MTPRAVLLCCRSLALVPCTSSRFIVPHPPPPLTCAPSLVAIRAICFTRRGEASTSRGVPPRLTMLAQPGHAPTFVICSMRYNQVSPRGLG